MPHREPNAGGEAKKPVVAVVGGGLAGLVAAKTLAEAGARVVVFEASPQLGGRATMAGETDFEHRGRQWQFDLEHGMHGIWRQYRNLRRVLSEHGLLDRLVPVSEQELISDVEGGAPRVFEYGARIRTSGLPDALALFNLLAVDRLAGQVVAEGPHRFVGAGSELLHALAFDPERDIARYDRYSVGDFLHRWPPLMRRLASVIAHAGFYCDGENVSLAAFLIGLRSYFMSDKRDLSFDVLATDIRTDLLRPLAGAIRARGGHIRLGTAVEALELAAGAPGRAAVLRSRRVGASSSGRTHVDGVVFATDPAGFRRLSRKGPMASLLREMAIPSGAASVVTRLWFATPPPMQRASAGVFHGLDADNFFWLHRLQSPYRAFHQSTGGGVLECHLYARRARRAAQLDDAAVVEEVLRTVAAAWPETSGQLIHSHVQRNASTNVVFSPGIMSRLPTVRTPLANVALAGDWIDCPTPVLYMERAATTALLAARHVGLACGLSHWDLPEPLPPSPPSASVLQAMNLARAMRRARLLPRIGRRWL